MNTYPTEAELRNAADVIGRLPRGFLPYEIFLAVTSKVVTPTMELAPLRMRADGRVEILLIRRPESDIHWRGQWHMSGTVIRSTDKEGDFSTSFERILQDELHGAVRVVEGPVYVGLKFIEIPRGREVDQLFYAEVEVVGRLGGEFFPVDELPDNLMESQRGMIAEIAESFLVRKKVS